jgi:DNA-binding MarR family transcriptional regulator
VLRNLWEEDGIQTSALSRGTPYDCATMTGVLDRLESRGLVRRERSSKDRRAVRIYLTPAGKALEEPLMRAVAQLNERAMAGLSPSEREELVRMLDHVGGNLDAW